MRQFTWVGAVVAIAMGVLLAGECRAGILHPGTFSASVNWTVTDALIPANNNAGSSALALPGSGVVSSTTNNGNGQVDTSWTISHGASTAAFTFRIAGNSGLGTTAANAAVHFTTTQWTRFHLVAFADPHSVGACNLAFNGLVAQGYFTISSPTLWAGDIPQAPDAYVRAGLLAPGTYDFEFGESQVMNAKYAQWFPQAAAASAQLALEQVDPSTVPLPPALLAGLALAAPLARRALKKAEGLRMKAEGRRHGGTKAHSNKPRPLGSGGASARSPRAVEAADGNGGQRLLPTYELVRNKCLLADR